MSIRQWTLHKDGETFIFRCPAGGEGDLLAEIAEQVDRGDLGLDDADLAALIRMVTETIAPGESAVTAMLRMAEAANRP